MMRNRIKMSLEWLHVFLILSMIAPLIYMGDTRRVPEQLYNIYFTSYILLVPIAVIMVASKRCKKLWQYLLIVACVYMAVSFGAKQLGSRFLNEIADMIYVGCMLICICVVAFLAFAMRIYKVRRQEAKEIGDASWREAEFELDKPNKMVCLWFIAVYVYALNMDCPQVCNIALYSTLAYLLVSIAHEFLDKTQEYLKLNEEAGRVRNIPHRRIYGIGKYFLIAYLVLLLLAIVPAVLTIGNRNYHDIRISHPSQTGMKESSVTYVREDFPEIMPEDLIQEREPVNETMILILDIILYGIAVVTVVIIIIAFLILVRRELAKFSQTAYEVDDVVESLEPTDEDERIGARRPMWKRTEEDKTRRLYRKFIRKHRKDRPGVYETPTEIETAAGVVDTEEGKELHKQYELVRYGSLSD